MMSEYFPRRADVAGDFRSARRRAALQSIVFRLTGKSTELLSYEEVRKKLRARETSARTLNEIPLGGIVGSVGRYKEFTRDFLPTKTTNADRWIRVKMAMTGSGGVPPIEVYRISGNYFVLDGNHRVSVAREMGLTHFEAYVNEVTTLAPLPPHASADDLILLAEYTEFLERIGPAELEPEAELRLTATGRYPILLEHVDVHRYYMGIDLAREIPFAEAFKSWYRNIYTPVARVIRERGLLRDFSERTETDLYLWISLHRAELEESLGWQISTDRAALDLAPQREMDQSTSTARARLLRALAREADAASRPRSEASRDHTPPDHESRFARDLLVAIDGEDSGWSVLDQAVHVAHRENARVLGLHVVPTDSVHSPERLTALRAQFEERCRHAGVAGRIAIESGKVAETLCKRARWADLVVTGLLPSATVGLRSRLGSEFRTLMRHCPQPVLVVPGAGAGAGAAPQRALLAYDGSPKSEEALYVACYLAGWWSLSLVVVTVNESDRSASETQDPARSYLEHHGIGANMVLGKGPVAQSVLHEADTHASDIIIMGGYGSSPPVEAVLGSAVDEVLRLSRRPVLILT